MMRILVVALLLLAATAPAEEITVSVPLINAVAPRPVADLPSLRWINPSTGAETILPENEFEACTYLPKPPIKFTTITENTTEKLLAGASARILAQPVNASGVPQDYSIAPNGLPPLVRASYMALQPTQVPMPLTISVMDLYMDGNSFNDWYATLNFNNQNFIGFIDPNLTPDTILPGWRESITPTGSCTVGVWVPPTKGLDEFDLPIEIPGYFAFDPCTPTNQEGDLCYCDIRWSFTVPWSVEVQDRIKLPLNATITVSPGLLDIRLPPADTRALSGSTGYIYVHVAQDNAEETFITALLIPVEILTTITRP